MPHWAISVALEQNDEIIAGVVFDPVKDEMFQAQKGMGAWATGASAFPPARGLPEAVFATGIPFLGIQDGDGHRHFLRRLEAVMAATAGVSAGAPRPWTWPMWQPAGTKRSGNAGLIRGTLLPACCWCARPAAW